MLKPFKIRMVANTDFPRADNACRFAVHIETGQTFSEKFASRVR